MRASRTVLAAAAALGAAALLGACSSSDTPGPVAPPAAPQVVFEGDAPPTVAWPVMSNTCLSGTAELRRLVDAHDYFEALDLSEAQRWLDGVNHLDDECSVEEGTALRAVTDRWFNAVPPTYDVDEYAELSARCAAALAPVREQLREPATQSGYDELVAAASAAFEESCTDAERLLFSRKELDPPQRRAGVLPPRSGAAPAAVGGEAPDVADPEARAAVSEGCDAALEDARAVLADSVGAPAGPQVRDRVAAALGAAADACNHDELTQFQAVEVASALSLVAPVSD